MFTKTMAGRVLAVAGVLGAMACTQACNQPEDANVDVKKGLETQCTLADGCYGTSSGTTFTVQQPKTKYIAQPPKGYVPRVSKCTNFVHIVQAGETVTGTVKPLGYSRYAFAPANLDANGNPDGTFNATTFLTNGGPEMKGGVQKIDRGQLKYMLHFYGVNLNDKAQNEKSGVWIHIGQPIPDSASPNKHLVDANGNRAIVAQTKIQADPKNPSVLFDTCVEPSKGLDDEGRPAGGGEDLAPVCYIENLNQNWDSAGYAVVNYAANKICTSNNPSVDPYAYPTPAASTWPHPDGAEYAGSGTFKSGKLLKTCYNYTLDGAALNDLNGMERNSSGDYYAGDHYCHMVIANGSEVPAAKRPATVSYPAPGIDPNTPVLWRPVDPAVQIATPGQPTPVDAEPLVAYN